MKKIELLAPAKDLECGKEAVNCGADALYIGASKFGARYKSGNSIEDIEALINYSHFYRVKVYVVLNTLLKDEELKEVENLIGHAHNIGADGIIIQDMGILEMKLPPIPIIASTQCHNYSAEKVKFLQDVGFSRAILARELSLPQIRQIHQAAPNIELESFIHGALCVSYSGQCNFSAALGGRSGNRGNCAQPCREAYSLVDSENKTLIKNKHLLSLKDFKVSSHLKELMDAGVSSFKIEGRLKNQLYIRNVVSFYRQELDKILEDNINFQKASSGKSIIDFKPNPAKTFNRDFTDYFIKGSADNIAFWDSPKAIGEKIGTVQSKKNGKYHLKLKPETTLHSGDGICYLLKDSFQGSQIVFAEQNIIKIDKDPNLPSKTILYRNYDLKFSKTLDKNPPARKIGLDFTITLNEKSLTILARDEDGTELSKTIPDDFEAAKNQEKAAQSIKKQFSKLGNTNYYLNQFTLNSEGPLPFFTAQFLNQTRREIIDELKQLRHAENHQSVEVPFQPNDAPYFKSKIYAEENVFNHLAQKFYERHGAQVMEMALEKEKQFEGKVIFTGKYCLLKQWGYCLKENPRFRNQKLYLKNRHEKKLELFFDCEQCAMKIKG